MKTMKPRTSNSQWRRIARELGCHPGDRKAVVRAMVKDLGKRFLISIDLPGGVALASGPRLVGSVEGGPIDSATGQPGG
jgi:hypothetical protein